jgi:hypothetical protein
MSNISAVHKVEPYTSGKSIALSGQRLAVAKFKTDKDTGVKPENKCASIPAVTDAEIQQHLSKLLPAFGRLIDETQDKIFRELVIDGAGEVHTEQVSIEACIQFLNAEATGNRLSKEFLESWFDSTLEDVLTVAVAEKMGVGEIPTETEVSKINATISVYRKMIAGLSSTKTVYADEVRASIKKALALVSDDKLAQRLETRIDEMKVAKVDMFAL